jgi:chaperone required for assembly of F1-ATPase
MPNMSHIRRFYKKVDVVEHPLSQSLTKLPADQKVSLQNLRHSHDKYYAVTLDGKVTKTLYKDDLCLPSRALAVALAEEWDSQ